MVIVLMALVTIEVAYKAVKKYLVSMGLWKHGRQVREKIWKKITSCGRSRRKRAPLVDVAEEEEDDWDTELWQMLERDPAIKERLRLICQAEDEAINGVEREVDVDDTRSDV